MSDVICPYCGSAQEINHDDGYGYAEDETHEQECTDCDAVFQFTTMISLSYKVKCQPDDHQMDWWGDKHPRMWGCRRCDHCEFRPLDTGAKG